VSAQVYYNSPSEGAAVVPVTFTSTAGVVTDPSSISCVVTDPAGASTTYTYLGTPPNNTVTRTSAGNYSLNLAGLTVAGLYVTTWIGTGNSVQQISPYTFRLVPLADVGTGMQYWYTGREELKSRLGITDSNSDYEIQLAIQAVANWINAYCVVPETPVLTASLEWVPAGELLAGDELVGFDEYPVGPRYPKRHYRRAVVTAAPRRKAACTRIVLDDGREVITAADHRWLAKGTARLAVYSWKAACTLQPGDRVASPVRAWPNGSTFEDGWMSGILDGEGWVHRARPGTSPRNGKGAHLGIAQNRGAVLDRVERYLKEAEIPYSFNSGGGTCQKIEVFSRWAAMELMGRLQPVRLMPFSCELWENGHISRKGPDSSARIVSVEPAGVREVVSLGTSTGTYIANGLASHNCGRHFYQLTEARTYCPDNIWELAVDDIVSTPAVAAACQVNIDYDGDGIFETNWGNPAPPVGTGLNYQLKLGTPGNYQDNYNVNAAGVPRPYTQLQVLQGVPGSVQAGSGWLPWVWPYTHLNRVQVITTWGWPTVPPSVQQASLLLCTDVFKSKDAPWGIAGTAETGLMRVQSNPWAVEFLHDYVNTRRKVGV
jgi:hypothetical protein